MDSRERLIQIKEASGMNWKEFSAYFQIPYRTVQDWERGNRKMPEYLLRLMEYKLRIEKIIE
ncbi:transcriptional regulator [Frisingicoccus sp.]|jgi:putative transcriptional regulator|uniref:helix-turn-helix domain-containing protein n=1 Tax=Frisingicoccus sp. TaxID=1918627 RepID=UPI0015B30966